MEEQKVFLLADDDQDDRYLFEMAIEELGDGVELRTAEDGLQALEMLGDGASSQPDVIFLDVNMPRLSGWECLSAIKTQPGLQHIPVIMFSTSSHQQDIQKAMALGAICFCIKPDAYDDLRAILRFVMENLGSDLAAALRARDDLRCMLS